MEGASARTGGSAGSGSGGSGSGGPRPIPLRPSDPVSIGGYDLLGLLGQGGMGHVYLGRERGGGRLVAVKVVRHDLAAEPTFTRRFHREAELARRVAQFCTAEVVDVGEQDGRPFLVTEYVDGPTLWDAVQLRGPMQRAQLERLAISVATALRAIHDAGMVHRDLKPSNVMLSSGGPLVIDFGIAHAMDGTVHLTTASLGTPAFTAPEQARGERVTPAADIFAWGGIVVYAATGNPPFGLGRPEELLYRVVHERPNLAGVPEPLRAVVEAAMHRRPDQRPTAEQLYDRLLASVSSQAARAAELATRPPSPPRPATPAQAVPPPVSPRSHPAPRDRQAAGPPAPGRAVAPDGITPDGVTSYGVTSGGVTSDGIPSHRARAAGEAASDDVLPSSSERRLRTRRTLATRVQQVPRSRLLPAVALAAAVGVSVPLLLVTSGGDDGLTPPRGRSDIATDLVAESRRLDADKPELARRLAVAAHAIAPSRETRFALADTAAAPAATLTPDRATAASEDLTVNKVAFGADGKLLVTATGVGLVEYWELSPSDQGTPAGLILMPIVQSNVGIDGDVFDVTLGGGRLAAGGAGGAVALLGLGSPTDIPSSGFNLSDSGSAEIRDLTFNGDASKLAAASDDGYVRVWNTATGTLLARSTSNEGAVQDVGFSSQGLLVTTSENGPVSLWTDTGEPVASLAGHTGRVNDLAFNGDGSRLATAGADGTVRLWDIGSRPVRAAPMAVLTGHTDEVVELAFGPDPGDDERQVLAAVSADGTARIWEFDGFTIPSAIPRAVLDGHHAGLVDLVFGPDGTLVTGSVDGTAQIWDIATGALLADVGEAGGTLRDINVDSGGTVLVTAGAPGPAEIWDLDPDRLFATACASPDSQLTEAEWDQYVPELAYGPPC